MPRRTKDKLSWFTAAAGMSGAYAVQLARSSKLHVIATIHGGGAVSSVVRPDAQRAEQFRVRPDSLIVDVNTAQLAQLAGMLRRKEIRTAVGSVVPLADARAAHQIWAERLRTNAVRSFFRWRDGGRSAIGTDGSVGIWHETHLVEPGKSECIYVNLPRFGLAAAATHVKAEGRLAAAGDRLKDRLAV
jgi:hypothetical protein